jgi:hypothetical protein
VAVLATAGLFLTGCGEPEQGQDAETTEEVRQDTEETASEETTGGETLVEETTLQEIATASDGEQAAKAEVATVPPDQAASPPLSDGESQPPDGLAPSQGLGTNRAGQAASNPSATPPAASIVFLPLGNGVTYSCTGGPPFVHYGHDASMGNCAVQHVLPPVGLVCDVPTTMMIVHDMGQLVFDASLCRSGTDTGFTSPEPALPAQAQPYPFATEPAFYGDHKH